MSHISQNPPEASRLRYFVFFILANLLFLFVNANEITKMELTGEKLRVKHTTAVEGLSVPLGQTLELTTAMRMNVDKGVIDYQGNVRLVVDGNGTIEQRNDYYAYGGPWGDNASTQGFQPFKYNGKELDRMHGLDWYDYGARMYDPAMGLFTQVDPLAEQYPHLNPYQYCAGNPVKYVDPDGKHIRVRKNNNGYEIVGGKVDDDLNIYDVTNGWENRNSIGLAMTQYSFMDDNGTPVLGAMIDLSDQSGQQFWNVFKEDNPFIFDYMLNGYGAQRFDFKKKGANLHPDKSVIQYNNRGMRFHVDGNTYIASARDIGNYAAGYVAGSHGLTWWAARMGFDTLETMQNKWHPSVESHTSRSAQFKGYLNGLKHISLSNALKLKLIEYKISKVLFP